MGRSLGIISGAFALKNRALALGGHVVFSFFERHFGGTYPRGEAYLAIIALAVRKPSTAAETIPPAYPAPSPTG